MREPSCSDLVLDEAQVALHLVAPLHLGREDALVGFEVGAGDGVNRINQDEPTVDFTSMDANTILSFDTADITDFEAWNKRMDELGL